MIKTKQAGNSIIVYLKGRLDVHLSAEIEKELNKLIDENTKADLIINMREVEYMSSSGLRILVAAMRILKEKDRSLRLCALNSAVRKVFEVVELIDMFEVYDTEEEAVQAS
ncbi:MAG: STAS domain-containing protein [Spirochaetia bacterium]|nr:STAS domain-containing protein [Spirochaetia bacterium]